MKTYRVVRVEKVLNPSGTIGIRHKPIGANANTRTEAEYIKDELTRILGNEYEIQEQEIPDFLLHPALRD